MNENLQKLIGMLIANEVEFEGSWEFEKYENDYLIHQEGRPWMGYILWQVSIMERTGDLILQLPRIHQAYCNLSVDEILEKILELEKEYQLFYGS